MAASTRMPSRPGEFHPEPLTDPDVTLSRHPARATARRLPPSVENWSSPCCQLARSQRRPAPFAPRALHPLRHYYRAVRPSPAHRYFRPRGWSRLRLVWGFRSQAEIYHLHLFLSFVPSLCSTGAIIPSSRPALRSRRRAQKLSRLAVAPTLRHAPPLPGHTLTASSTTARLVRSG